MGLFRKLKNASPTVKATLAFGIASFAVSGINYITTPIFTRLLSVSEYGVITVYNSWYEIVRVFATMTLIFPGILQVGLYEHKENRWKYLSSTSDKYKKFEKGLKGTKYWKIYNKKEKNESIDYLDRVMDKIMLFKNDGLKSENQFNDVLNMLYAN